MKKRIIALAIAILTVMPFVAACQQADPAPIVVTYDVTLNFEGATLDGETDSATFKVVAGEKFSLKGRSPLKLGHFKWLGWLEGEALRADDYEVAVDSDLAFTANWREMDPYWASFDYNGGRLGGEKRANTENWLIKLSEYAPIRPNYKLTGWIDQHGEEYEADDETELAFHTEFIAQWAPNYSDVSLFDFTLAGEEGEEYYILNGFAEGKTAKTVVVPAEYEGKPVTAVADEAFAGNEDLEVFVAEKHIISLGNHLFDDCPNMSDVTLPMVINKVNPASTYYTARYDSFSTLFTFAGVMTEWNALNPTGNLTPKEGYVGGGSGSSQNTGGTAGYIARYYIPVSLKRVTVIGGELSSYAFGNMTTLDELRLLSDDITAIPSNFFSFPTDATLPAEGHNLKTLDLSGIPNLVTIADSAMTGGVKLQEIDFTGLANLESIGHQAFYGLGMYADNPTENPMDLNLSDCELLESIGYAAFMAGNSTMNASNINAGTSVPFESSLRSVDLSGCRSLSQFKTSPSSGYSSNMHTFSGHKYLEEVRLPAGVQVRYAVSNGFTSDFFYGSPNVDVIVDALNPYVTVEDGIIFDDAEKTRIIKFPTNYKSDSYTIPESVTDISNYAFRATNLKSVTVPETVTTMGTYVFANCESLTAIVWERAAIPAGTFSGCTALASWTIPAHVNNIGNYAFAGTGLTGITMPGTVTTLGTNVFDGCESLYDVTWNIATISNYTFRNCTALTEFDFVNNSPVITNIGAYAFSGTGLTSVIMPPVSGIGTTISHNYMFADCKSLATVIWNNKIVPTYAFLNCTSLTAVAFTEALTTIGNNAFAGSGIKSVTIPSTFTTGPANTSFPMFDNCLSLKTVDWKSKVAIPANTFRGCAALTEITVPDDIASVNSNAFTGSGLIPNAPDDSIVYVGTWAIGLKGAVHNPEFKAGTVGVAPSAFQNSPSLTGNVTLPGSLKTISASAFGGSSSGASVKGAGISSITIPSGVTSIGTYAFASCDNLETVNWHPTLAIPDNVFAWSGALENFTVPAGVTNIGGSAFRYSGLKSIAIPSTVTTVGSAVFQYCASLETVNWQSNAAIGANMFNQCAKLENVTLSQSLAGVSANAFNGTAIYNGVPDNGIVYADKWVVAVKGNPTVEQLKAETEGIFDNAFSGKASMAGALPAFTALRFLGANAFYNTKITSATIPATVASAAAGTSATTGVFAGCTELAAVTWNSALAIPNRTFQNCAKLESVTLSNTTAIGDYAFTGCSGLASVTIPVSVESIGAYAFQNCAKLAAVTLNEGLKIINNYAFAACGITGTLAIPGSVKYIGSYAFQNGNKIAAVEIGGAGTVRTGSAPSTLTNLDGGVTIAGASAAANPFVGCASLADITIYGTGTLVILNGTTHSATLLLPAGVANIYVDETLADAYRGAANWKNYAAKIAAVPVS